MSKREPQQLSLLAWIMLIYLCNTQQQHNTNSAKREKN